MLLDEPAAGLTIEASMKLASLLRNLAQRWGVTVLIVEHDMDFVAKLSGAAGTVTVLHEGSVLAEGPMAQVQGDDRVIEVYLGR